MKNSPPSFRLPIRSGLAALGLAAVVAVSGCAPSAPPEIDSALSSELTTGIRAVADVAATGDYAGATAKLDELSARVEAAAGEGTISAARLMSVQNAIATVRTDLEQLIAAAEQAAAEQAAAEQAERDRIAQEQAAAEQAAKDQAARDQAAQEAADEAARQAEEQAKDDAKNDKPTGPGENNGGPGKKGKKDD